MADKTNYIKIDRNILEWRWFKNAKVYQVFSWLIIKANIKDHSFQRETIHRGSLVTSYESIADGCGMSVGSVRRAIACLKDTGEIEQTIKSHYQIIKILKYDEYQGCSKTIGQTASTLTGTLTTSWTGKRQQSKNDKNDKNGKKEKEGSLRSDSPFGEFRRGTDEFRNRSHLLLKPDEGTVDDIPVKYRDGTYNSFDNFADYWGYRNQ